MKRALFAKAPVFGERFATADYKFAAPKRRKRRRTAQGVFERPRSVFEKGRTRNFEGIFASLAENLRRHNGADDAGIASKVFQTRSRAVKFCSLPVGIMPGGLISPIRRMLPTARTRSERPAHAPVFPQTLPNAAAWHLCLGLYLCASFSCWKRV